MSTITVDIGYENWIKSIKRHTGISLSLHTCSMIDRAELAWGRQRDPLDQRMISITEAFSQIDDFDLSAMETCSHQNTPFGYAVRSIIFERLLLSQK